MTRTSTRPEAPRQGLATAAAIREAAVARFHEHGYHATSLRDIASDVGIQVASLYNHFDAKDDLLARIVVGASTDRLLAVEAALATEVGALRRLEAGVECHLRLHLHLGRELAIAEREVGALPDAVQREARSLRGLYDETLGGLVEDACAAEAVHPLDIGAQVAVLHSLAAQIDTTAQHGRRTDTESTIRVSLALALRCAGVGQRLPSAVPRLRTGYRAGAGSQGRVGSRAAALA